MDVTKLPFNAFLGIKSSKEENFLLELDYADHFLNHLGTIHASVQFALAEAASGEFLLRTFSAHTANIIPVVRKAEIKFRKPAEGKIITKAKMDEKEKDRVRDELTQKGRSLIPVIVEVYDGHKNLTLQAEFEWFVQKQETQ